MKTKTILTYLLIGFQTILFSQENKTINANSSWNGLHCRGASSAPCTIDYVSNKAQSNTIISFDKENNELILKISISKIDSTSKAKLLNKELEKNFYLYTIDEKHVLSADIKNMLGITDFTKIKTGNYLIKEQHDFLTMILKLE
jgi:hypothetical protein